MNEDEVSMNEDSDQMNEDLESMNDDDNQMNDNNTQCVFDNNWTVDSFTVNPGENTVRLAVSRGKAK